MQHWTLVVQPGDAVDVVPSEWADSLVIVLAGELDVQCHSGQRARFPAGAILTLAGLPVRTLHNPRSEPLVLYAVTRNR
jgi:hypothetical protein